MTLDSMAQNVRQFVITGMTQMTPFAGHDRCRVLQHPRVSVETNQDSVRLDFGKDVSAVATSANRAVNDCQPRTQVESLQRFPQQNGDVNCSQGRCVSEWKWPENSGGCEAGSLGKATSTQPCSAKWAGLYVDFAKREKSKFREPKRRLIRKSREVTSGNIFATDETRIEHGSGQEAGNWKTRRSGGRVCRTTSFVLRIKARMYQLQKLFLLNQL